MPAKGWPSSAVLVLLAISLLIPWNVVGTIWQIFGRVDIGLLGHALAAVGIDYNYTNDALDAWITIVVMDVWHWTSLVALLCYAGLQSIPRSVLEAAAIDGASPMHRFRTVIFPLLSPTTFFLLVINITYAFFDTFGIIDALTKGGPGNATQTLIYRAYVDGRVNLDIGSSSAQSVVLMIAVMALTLVQFRFIERKVHY